MILSTWASNNIIFSEHYCISQLIWTCAHRLLYIRKSTTLPPRCMVYVVALWHVEHVSHARDLGSNPVWSGRPSLKSLRPECQPPSVISHFLIVECTKDSVRVTKKNIQIVVRWLGWKWLERFVLQLLLLKPPKSRTIAYMFMSK